MPSRRRALPGRCVAASFVGALVGALVGCGAGDASRRTVFDPAAAGGPSTPLAAEAPRPADSVERPFPPLDVPDRGGAGRLVGVSVLRDGVRLARPAGWMLRDAGDDPGRAYVRYVSPRAYSFAIYERSDAPDDRWGDILQRYEADVAAVGAKMLGKRIPVAVSSSQGRAYTIERKADPAEGSTSRSREILVRGRRRVVLVQIVMQGDELPRLSAELLDVLARLEVT